jgi:hypothetical protein
MDDINFQKAVSKSSQACLISRSEDKEISETQQQAPAANLTDP